MSCQLAELVGLIEKNSFLNEISQSAIRRIHPLKGRLIFLKRRMLRRLGLIHGIKDNARKEIRAGDLVRVRSKKEICSILDDWRRYKGCSFMDEMYEYCDKRYRVLKKVQYFYDEVKQEVVKCKDIVILDGLICSGRRKLYRDRCDRNCFLFWHKDWLEKVEKPSMGSYKL
jgi:hypothetical protein